MVCAALGGCMTAVIASVSDQLMSRRVGRSTHPVQVRMSRNELPALCQMFGYFKGAEIGVWKGAFSAQFCAVNPALHMLCVDPWQSYPAWLDTKNAMPVESATRLMEDAYRQAQERLKPMNATIVRKFSADAAREVPDRSLDFVYVDSNHSYESVTEDLELWAPKVRSGGWIGGHDYRHFTNKPTIHVIEAVDAYTQAHAIDPWFVLMGDRTPSFLWMVR